MKMRIIFNRESTSFLLLAFIFLCLTTGCFDASDESTSIDLQNLDPSQEIDFMISQPDEWMNIDSDFTISPPEDWCDDPYFSISKQPQEITEAPSEDESADKNIQVVPIDPQLNEDLPAVSP